MKPIVTKITTHPFYDKSIHWFKVLILTGGAQTLIQAISLVTGIIVIRLLSVQEYAYYTIANTMLGTMTVLADGGVSTGVMAEGGKVWQDRQKLGAVLKTGLYLRKRFAIASLSFSLPILAYLLYHQGTSWITISLIILALIPSFYAALSDSILEIVPKLHQDVKSLQGNQLAVSVFRIIFSISGLFFLPFTSIALIANGLPRIYGNIRLKTIAEKKCNSNTADVNEEVQRRILKIVSRVLPGCIYYCFSGQITIWLISLFGNNSSVAQVGALGRLTMLLSIITMVFNIIIIPRFARLKQDSIVRKLLLIFSCLIGIGISLCFVVYIFSAPLLMLLGNDYNSLNSALVLNFVGGFIGVFASLCFNLFMSRGWTINPAFSITVSIGGLIAGISIFPINTLQGVLYMNIFVNSVQFILNAGFLFFKTLSNK